jgi:hypothetical protein
VTDAHALPVRPMKPRCLRAWPRTVAVLVTAPLVMCAVPAVVGGLRTGGDSGVYVGIAAALGLIGGWIWTFSRRGPFDAALQRRRDRRLARHAADPWAVDHRWDAGGSKTGLPLPDVGCGDFFLLWAACLVTSGWPPLMLGTAGAWLVWIAWRAWRSTGRGRAHASFTQFPYFLGGPVELHFGVSEGGATFLSARYLLTRVQEVDFGFLGGGPRRRWKVVSECVPEEGVLPGPGADVRLVFDAPAHEVGTTLSAALPTYWELRVVGETTSGPFDEVLLVPVYARPAGGREDPTP